MQKLRLVAIGSIRGSIYQPCFDEYVGRLMTEFTVKELNAPKRGKQNEAENKLILDAISKESYIIALDGPNGKSVS